MNKLLALPRKIWPVLAALGLGLSAGLLYVATAPANAGPGDAHNYLYPTSRYGGNCQDGGPGYGHICRLEYRTVTWYMDSSGEFELETPDRNAVNAALDNNYRPTVLAWNYASDPVFTGNYETDVIYQEGTLPEPYVGYTWCDDQRGGWTCDQTYIRIRGNGEYTSGLVCHETGHAVGLVHGENTSSNYGNQNATRMGCMVKSNVPAGAALISAQKADINDVY